MRNEHLQQQLNLSAQQVAELQRALASAQTQIATTQAMKDTSIAKAKEYLQKFQSQ